MRVAQAGQTQAEMEQAFLLKLAARDGGAETVLALLRDTTVLRQIAERVHAKANELMRARQLAERAVKERVREEEQEAAFARSVAAEGGAKLHSGSNSNGGGGGAVVAQHPSHDDRGRKLRAAGMATIWIVDDDAHRLNRGGGCP